MVHSWQSLFLPVLHESLYSCGCFIFSAEALLIPCDPICRLVGLFPLLTLLMKEGSKETLNNKNLRPVS